MKYIFCGDRGYTVIFAIYFSLVFSSFAFAEELSPDDIYRDMTKCRSTILNFQCSVEYQFSESVDYQKRSIESLRKKKIPEYKIDSLLKKLPESQEITETRQYHNIAFDNRGRSRVEIVIPPIDKLSQDQASNVKHISTWDGKNSITYTESPGRLPGAVIDTTPPFESSDRFQQPWRQFGGNFCDSLGKAISNKTKIDVSKLNNGNYRIIIYNNAKKQIAIIDPSKRYSLLTQEHYRNNILVERYQANYQEMGNGIWFPVSGVDERYFKDKPEKLRSKIIIKISQIKLNAPAFNENMFQVAFPKGTHIKDAVSGMEFIVGEPGSEKISGLIHKTANQIADEHIKEILNMVTTTQPELKKKLVNKEENSSPKQILTKDIAPRNRSYLIFWLLPIVLFLGFLFIKKLYKY